MLVSVVMPVYNSEAYLPESIESILSQTYKDFEFLIINDGSTDKSAEIISLYQDPRIRFFNFKTNDGYTNRLNFGLQKAKGVFIARLDSDDIALPNRLEHQLAVFEKEEECVVCGSNIQLFGDGWLTENWVVTGDPDLVKVSLLVNNSVCHPSVMIRASTLKKHHLFYQPSYEPCEDYKLWADLSHKGKIINITEILLRYRTHSKQVSKTRTLEQRRSRERIIKELLANLGINPSATELLLHDTLETSSQIIMQPNYLMLLHAWFNKLIDANKATGIYNTAILESYLDQLYHQKKLLFKKKYAALSSVQKIKFELKKVVNQFTR